MNRGGFQLWVTWPKLVCFGCGVSTSSELERLFYSEVKEPRLLPPLSLTGSLTGSGQESSIDSLGPESVVIEANKAGWRKITLYGKPLILCPECAKQTEPGSLQFVEATD